MFYAIICVICVKHEYLRKNGQVRTALCKSHRLKGMHDTLIAVSWQTRQAFKSLKDEGKLHCRVRATDVRHLLLLLPFMVHDLFSSEVKTWNAVPGHQQIQDPSPEIVSICLSLLEWYHMYRRSGHTTEDT